MDWISFAFGVMVGMIFLISIHVIILCILHD